MHALVIGFPLPNPQIDNYNVLTSPSWYDYDGVLVEPLSVSHVIEDVVQQREAHEARSDEPVLNRPTTALSVGLADVVRRRRAEVTHLLARGGVVVVFAQPEVVHEGVVGFAGCDRYAWLPAPAGLAYDAPFLLRAEGTDVHTEDNTHSFARFVDAHRQWVAYRARFDETVPGFTGVGHVFARSVGGAAVGIDLKVGGGRVVFLPAFGSIAYGDQRFQLATGFLEALRVYTTGARAAEPPDWVKSVAVEGAAELEAGERSASESLKAAEISLQTVQSELLALTRYRRLLWEEGSLGLEPIVRDAFRKLGFEVEADPDKPGWIADGSLRAFFEVEASADAVLEYPYFRLQKRLEKDLIASKDPKKGLIVVNGRRLQQPEERGDQVSETLRVAAENYRYALLTTTRLFQLVTAVLERPYSTVLRALLRRGLLEAVGEVAEEIIPSEEQLT